jgi:hypothetical protein
MTETEPGPAGYPTAADAPREPNRAGSPGVENGFSGTLRESPLFVVLRRIQRQRLSGTLSVFREEQVRQLFFENGELAAARSSQEDHRIGRTLVRWGYITEHELLHALEVQRQTHERIDKVLVESGLVTRVLIDSEARRQMEQIVFSTLSWPDGAFHFEANTGELELDVAVSLSQEMIIEGIRRIPESEQFTDLLGDLSAVPTLTRDPMSSGAFRLLRDAVEILDQIDGRRSAQELLRNAPVSGSASAKILYSLLFAGLIEMRPPDASAPAPDAIGGTELGFQEPRTPAQQLLDDSLRIRRPSQRAIPMPGPEALAERTPRQIVLETYRQLDWLSHYDLLGVSRKATVTEIEEAFKARSRLFDPSLKAHPELVDCWRQLTVLMKWLKVAHGVLSNPTARAAYDRKIDEAGPPPRTLPEEA